MKSNNCTLITNIPSPYRVPFWDEICKKVKLNVICIAANEKNRKWTTESRVYISYLHSFHLFISKTDWAIHFTFPLVLFFKLLKKSPDTIIVTGYDAFPYWEALLYAIIFKKHKVLWNGSTLLSSKSQSKLIYWLKSIFINSFDKYYTYGNQATKYIESFGVDSNDIVTGTNCIDTKFFKQNTYNKHPTNKKIQFLFVGQLIKRKGLESTIKAFSYLKDRDWQLSIVGSGEYEVHLRQLVKNLKLENNICFVSFKQQKELLAFYSNSDVFIMPSYSEVWGLVLNEALASGLFCLSSKYAGATKDLIKNQENGFIIDPYDISDIQEKIEACFTANFIKTNIKNSFIHNYNSQVDKVIECFSKNQ